MRYSTENNAFDYWGKSLFDDKKFITNVIKVNFVLKTTYFDVFM